MPTCPHCKRLVAAEAAICPHCQTPLKAFGHPGIPLHQAEGNEPLCDRCSYHADDSCTYPQRPHATSCTLFRDRDKPLPPERQRRTYSHSFVPGALLILVAIAAIALLFALL